MRTTPTALVIATQNRDKAREIEALLAPLPVTLRGLWEWHDAPIVEETGQTLEANAALKAESAARHTGLWAVADDTGLEVDALHGAPGVYSARFAGQGATYAGNRAKLLDLLTGVSGHGRGAHFRTAVALARPGQKTLFVCGAVSGLISDEERGDFGFGYDAVFLYPEMDRTFAEMTPVEKNAVSHRGRALSALRELLSEVLEVHSGE